jgi:hypothetical protein
VLSRAFSGYKDIAVANQNLKVNKYDANALAKVHTDLSRHKRGDIVVYVPIEANDGIRMVRVESSSSSAGWKDSLVNDSAIPFSDALELFKQANQPASLEARRKLREALLPSDKDKKDDKKDDGKILLFRDSGSFGLLPEYLEVGEGVTIGSRSVGQSINNLARLKQLQLKPAEITAVVGFPETEQDLKTVYGKDLPTADLDTWKTDAAAIRKLSDQHKFILIASAQLNAMSSTRDVLTALEKSKGIMWITAHANHCQIRLPGGESVNITPQDIASLKLANNPFVMIRSCNGNEAGFAGAFLKAGASGVWINEGPIPARLVNSEIGLFMDTLSADSHVLEAVKKVKSQIGESRTGTGLHVELERPAITEGHSDAGQR